MINVEEGFDSLDKKLTELYDRNGRLEEKVKQLEQILWQAFPSIAPKNAIGVGHGGTTNNWNPDHNLNIPGAKLR